MNGKIKTFAVLATALLTMVALVPAASAQAPAQTTVLTGVRVGKHADFDRVVLDFTGPAPQVSAQVVDQLYYDGSGKPVEIDGTYFLEVRSTPAAAHDDNGQSTYPGPRKFTTPQLGNVQAFALTGDFEGYLTVGLGYRRIASHQVFTLTDPTRVVIDIKH